MDLGIVALLFAAGLAGGIVNAIAGGATLITFPAMLAAGLPPITANASSAVAVAPGHLIAAFADRTKLPRFDVGFAVLTIVALIGGAAGAILLLATASRVFEALVPALIGVATALFALAPRINAFLASRTETPGRRPAGAAGLAAFAPITVYGGYFGAGLGIMMMTVLSITTDHEMRAVNAMKNLLSTAVSLATIMIFILQAALSWPETIVMLAGAISGGFAGGRLIQILPTVAVRWAVVAAGSLTTLIYAGRYWF